MERVCVSSVYEALLKILTRRTERLAVFKRRGGKKEKVLR